jgi:hypothetical protein
MLFMLYLPFGYQPLTSGFTTAIPAKRLKSRSADHKLTNAMLSGFATLATIQLP